MGYNGGGYAQTDSSASAINPFGQKRVAQAQAQQNDPYRGGLQTSFTGAAPQDWENVGGHNPGGKQSSMQFNSTTGEYGHGHQVGLDYNSSTDSDADVRGAQAAYNQMTHGDAGTSNAEQTALYNQYLTRIGVKNSMSEEINDAPGLLNKAQDQNKLASGEALGEGLKHTRENFNSRGLLYSGAREGGEQGVQAAGASQLARNMAGSARDSANSTNAAKMAYASADLANQQDTLNKANMAFDTANQNNIARLQATQQLMGGVGQAAGSIAGSYNSSPSTTTPNNGYSTNYNYNPNASNGYQGLLSQGAHFQ